MSAMGIVVAAGMTMDEEFGEIGDAGCPPNIELIICPRGAVFGG
tara:strand:+ start:482 stop:613 length:132 start_codon:yes stop_codon:yes gene_type:complete